jgi:threonine dehydrogenase-like Zn-dependent dehydrogenase
MRALVIDGGHGLTLREEPVPRARDECLVRVRVAGICGTDLELLRGYAGFSGIPGHEFVGIVEDAPPRDAAWIGRRVVGEINVGCGTCRFCRQGVKEHCEARSVMGIRGRGGAFAEYVRLPAENLHSVPDSLDDECAVFVEPLAAACRILEQVPMDTTTRTAIVGDGRLGLLAAQILRTAVPVTTVVGRHDDKLAIARRLGCETVHTDRAGSLAAAFDVVVEASGRPEGFRTARMLVRPRGTIVLKSTFHGDMAWSAWPIVVDEISLIGSRCGPFAPALALLAAGRVDVRPLVADVRPLEDFAAAFDAARRALKVLLRP